MLPSMSNDSFTHEISDDPMPRRRVRVSGPVYDDSCVPLLRVEYEDGNAVLVPPSELRVFRPLSVETFRGNSSRGGFRRRKSKGRR
jgi:hypothetical protein